MPPLIKQIDHVEVFVRDIPAAAKWYADVFGLIEICRWNPEPVMLGLPAPDSPPGAPPPHPASTTKLALFQAVPNTPKSSEESNEGQHLTWHRVAWLTDQPGFEAIQSHLRTLNIPFSGPINHRRSESIYLLDLDAHPLEVTWYR